MSVRDFKFSDNGITEEQIKAVRAYYKSNDTKRSRVVFDMATKIKPELAGHLYYSIVTGLSYDSLNYILAIPIPRTDFYGYQRKVYAELFKSMRDNARG